MVRLSLSCVGFHNQDARDDDLEKATGTLKRVNTKDYDNAVTLILDTRGSSIWRTIFFIVSLASLFIDPLYAYSFLAKKEMCIHSARYLDNMFSVLRSISDLIYVGRLLKRLYIRDKTYLLGKQIWVDVIISLPLPQVLALVVFPHISGMDSKGHLLRFTFVIQYLFRVFNVFPIVTEAPWLGVVYNVGLYLLAAHVIGSMWYLLSLERQVACWRQVCKKSQMCSLSMLHCHLRNMSASSWSNSTYCDPSKDNYHFGIYGEALTGDIITSSSFFDKLLYSIWWGLKNLSSVGQNLTPSKNVGEILFVFLISFVGLHLFAAVIVHADRYFKGENRRLEEWSSRRMDLEKWMKHRKFPELLKNGARSFDKYRWVANRGVDEENLINGLPLCLRKKINKHLCHGLVCRVKHFREMDPRILSSMCETMKPILLPKGTCLFDEQDIVHEIVFITRGQLLVSHSCKEEVFGPQEHIGADIIDMVASGTTLPHMFSSSKVIAGSDFEGFTLSLEDIKAFLTQDKELAKITKLVSDIKIAWRYHRKRKQRERERE